MAEKSESVPVSSVGLSLGQFVLFKSGGDWYRGAVSQVKESGKVRISSPDFGFHSKSFRASEADIRQVPSGETLRAKFWASVCSLGPVHAELCQGTKEEGDRMEVSVISMANIKYIVNNHEEN